MCACDMRACVLAVIFAIWGIDVFDVGFADLARSGRLAGAATRAVRYTEYTDTYMQAPRNFKIQGIEARGETRLRGRRGRGTSIGLC